MYIVSKIEPDFCKMPNGGEIIAYIDLEDPEDDCALRLGLLKWLDGIGDPLLFPKGEFGTAIRFPLTIKAEIVQEIERYLANMHAAIFGSLIAENNNNHPSQYAAAA